MHKKNIFNSSIVSRELFIGNIAIGGSNPIRIQSMTSTNTNDIDASIEQCIRLVDAGCELIRITTPGTKEVEALKTIHQRLRGRGIKTPLIADVHFNPKVAEEAAKFVEKVRINPGNYIDRNASSKIHFSDAEYESELEKMAINLAPLIRICKAHNTAIRIGSNQGSLSQRIMSKYGDTPLGMVESAMEFVEICERLEFHNIVLSMKSSNPKVMVQANRLLVNRMLEEGMNYPIHLGVTEAGNGIEGRIKSAAGIGTLLEEGIGDTIRVSLTEDPEYEIPVAKSIVKKYNPLRNLKQRNLPYFSKINPFEYNKGISFSIEKIGCSNVPIIVGESKSKADYSNSDIEKLSNQLLVLSSSNTDDIIKTKQEINTLFEKNSKMPIIIKRVYSDLNEDDFIVRAAIDFASLQIDGLGDGIWIKNDSYNGDLIELSKQILQACGTRITATEYIACPSCGRTQYDIQSALEKVKQATRHLVGLKIAVMGCVVNGPGEMADANYGYVGAGKGKVNLYKSRTLVKKGIPEENAIDALIQLIKTNGDWVE